MYYVLKNQSMMVEDGKVRNVFDFFDYLSIIVVREEGKLELIIRN